MTKDEKTLLLQDLCARLPYGVQVFVEHDKYAQATLLGVDIKQFSIIFGGNNWSSISNIEGHHIEQYKQLIKPYLRPMSSMTEEEREEERKLWDIVTTTRNDLHYLYTVFLLSHHFDYRGLIDKGLALPATEDMYNN